jgi:hypothetical protein
MPESELNKRPSPQGQSDSGDTPSLTSVAGVIREFFVDFLGSLVPGFLFVSLSTPLLLWLLWLFRESITLLNRSPIPVMQPLEIITSFHVELAITIFVFAYVLGSVFFRQDPKVPDQESAAHVLEKITDINEVKRLVIQPPTEEWEQIQKELTGRSPGEKLFTEKQAEKWASGEGGQYPYSHLKQYLETRGLGHLACYVKWDWNEKKGSQEGQRDLRNLRSKMFINVLKIRLQYSVPEKCGEIVRNEAHVRMMSSVWYACKALQKLFFCVVGAAFIPMLTLLWKTHDYWMLWSWAMEIIALALISAVPANYSDCASKSSFTTREYERLYSC